MKLKNKAISLQNINEEKYYHLIDKLSKDFEIVKFPYKQVKKNSYYYIKVGTMSAYFTRRVESHVIIVQLNDVLKENSNNKIIDLI